MRHPTVRVTRIRPKESRNNCQSSMIVNTNRLNYIDEYRRSFPISLNHRRMKPTDYESSVMGTSDLALNSILF